MLIGLFSVLTVISVYSGTIIDYGLTVEKEITCLAKNIYFESRNQPIKGQIAVGQVTLNRVNSPSSQFKDTICNVVEQPAQFSWFQDKKNDKMVNFKAGKQSYIIASGVISNEYPDVVQGAIYFHKYTIIPYWAHKQTLITTIGDHIFYK